MPASPSPQVADTKKTHSPFPHFASVVDQLALSQRRNAEAATELAKLTAGSVQAVWQKQWQLFNDLVADAQNGHHDVWAVATPDELVAKRAAVAKTSAEKVVASTREITDLFMKSGTQVADLFTKRMTESVAELQVFPNGA
jgi:phasin family protein